MENQDESCAHKKIYINKYTQYYLNRVLIIDQKI